MRALRWAAAAVAVALLGLVGAAAPATAASSSEEITTLSVAAFLERDTTVRITETIDYDFGYGSRHGIRRDIPLEDEIATGGYRSYDVEVGEVTVDGDPVPVQETIDGSWLRLRIGDPDRMVTGQHTYTVTYTVSGALRALSAEEAAAVPGAAPGDVEFYWDLVGDRWEVPIKTAYASVTGPDAPIAARCFTGGYGASTGCDATVIEDRVVYGPVDWLPPGSGVTGTSAWPRAAFTADPAPHDSTVSRTQIPMLAGAAVGLLALILPIVMAVRWRRQDAGAWIGAAPAQYSAPDGLRPAEVAAGWDGKGMSMPRALVATLLDLAARGYLTLTPAAPGSSTLIITSAADSSTSRRWVSVRPGAGRHDPAGVSDWEAGLLERMFGPSPVPAGTTTLLGGGYDPALATWANGMMLDLTAAAEAAGRRNPRGGLADDRWVYLIGPGMAIAFITLWFSSVSPWTSVLLLGGIGAAVGGAIAKIITPRTETPSSARFRAKVAGLEKVLSTDPAAARRQFAHASGLSAAAIFATMLPYAVVLKCEHAWGAAFPDLTGPQLAPYGITAMDVAAMSMFVADSSAAFTGSLTPPSASGGSGLGGGGFSGGGGGGGGGGSW